MKNLRRTATKALLSAFAIAALGGAAHAEEVRFVVFGDSQLENPGVFERMVHEANLLRPHFTTTTGDMIVGYTDNEERIRSEWERFQRQIEPLTMPFHPVPGNHDVGTAQSHRIYAEVWGEDRYYYSYDYGPVHCIALDSYHADLKDRIGPEQFEWLENDLQQYAEAHGGIGSDELEERTIIVFVHSPFWQYAETHDGAADWERVHELLQDYPVRMVVGGQTEREHYYVWKERDGIDYVVVNSSVGLTQENERAGFFHAFLHVTVEGNEVHPAVVRAGSILPPDTVTPEEHERFSGYALRDGTIRIDQWIPGEPVETEVTVPVENRADEERTFSLSWNIGEDLDVTVEPAEALVDVPAESTGEVTFTIHSDAAPERQDKPTLHLESTSTFRSGTVPREWEERYLRELDRAGEDEDVPTTSIPLEKEYTFDAEFTLYVPPRVIAARRTGPVRIDGMLEDASWHRTESIAEFRQSGTDEPAPRATTVKFLYDDDYLYAGAWMDEPNPENLKADAEGEIPLTWNDDDIEFFFDPTREGLDHTRIFENAAGTRFNARPAGHPERYDPMDYESAIRTGGYYWSIEMRIPWSDIPGAEPPEPGTEWSINVWRHRQQSDPPRYYWAVDEYDQTRYGTLEFQ